MREAEQPSRGLFALVLVIAAAARILALLALREDLAIRVPISDAQYYMATAVALANGEGWPAGPHFMAPVYPLLLSLVFRIAPQQIETVQWIQLLLGLATTSLVFLSARRIDHRAAVAAGLFYALCGPAIAFENLILMEALLAFCLTAVVWFAGRERAGVTSFACAGLAAGAATAGRPVYLLLLPLLLAFAARTRPSPGRIRAVGMVLLAFVIVVLPPTIRNWRETGHASFVTVSGGLNLFLGNNPTATGLYGRPPGLLYLESDPTGTQSASRLAGRRLDPGEASRFFAGKAYDFVSEHPGAAARLLLRKAGYMISPEETPQIEGMAELRARHPVLWVLGLVGFPLLFPLALLGAWGVRRGRRTWGLCLAVLLAGASVHLIFFSTGRYRVAMLPALAILAGHGAVRFAGLRAERGRRLLRGWPVLLGIVLLLIAPRYDHEAFRAWAFHQTGTRFDQLGATKAAAEMYEKALELDPTLGESWHNLAACKARDGRNAEAIDDYETALRYLGDHPLTLWNVGVLYGGMGMHERALAYLDRALAADPTLAAARVDRGIALFRQARTAEAFEEWRRVAQTNHGEPSLKSTLDRLMQLGVALPDDLRRIAQSN